MLTNFLLVKCNLCDTKANKPRRAFRNMKSHFLNANRKHPENFDTIRVSIFCACPDEKNDVFEFQIFNITSFGRVPLSSSIRMDKKILKRLTDICSCCPIKLRTIDILLMESHEAEV